MSAPAVWPRPARSDIWVLPAHATDVRHDAAVNWTRDALADAGFSGFVRFAELPAAKAPTQSGVYIVFRTASTKPTFLSESPAGWLGGKDPSVPIADLEAAWVDGACVVYIGKADSGSTGKRGLRRRLDEYRRHGAGGHARHWGGRYIWQLADHDELLVGWKPTAGVDPRVVERTLIAGFSAAHSKRPFANRRD